MIGHIIDWVITILAFIGSAYVIIKQHIIRRESLEASLVCFDYYASSLKISVAILNTGNRYGGIISMNISYTFNELNGEQSDSFLSPLTNITNLPIVIKPNEILVKKVEVQLNIPELFQFRPEVDEMQIININLDFRSINSRGKVVNTSHKIGQFDSDGFKFFNMQVTSDKNMNLYSKKKYPKYQLKLEPFIPLEVKANL